MNNNPIHITLLTTDINLTRQLKSSLANQTIFKTFPHTTDLQDIISEPTDVLILDEANGLFLSAIDICKIVRLKNMEVIIIILAQPFDITKKTLALELGADDYLAKPPSTMEIMARIKVTMRRMITAETLAKEAGVFEFNDVYIDAKRRKCVINDHEIKLANYEFLTLLKLVQHAEKTVARTTFLNDIWELPDTELGRQVDDVIRRLRKKFRDYSSSSQITAHWGYGYRIEVL